MTVIGFIGLGTMGGPMAANLVKAGYEVKGFDLVPAACYRAVEDGIKVTSSAVEAADGVDVLITMLPKGDHVRQALLVDNGPLSVLAPGAVVIDSSSIDVPTSRDLHERGVELGIDVLDAPVSGGLAGAQAGTLTFMIGGASEIVEKVRPLFQAMGSRTVLTGGPGSGQVAKAVNQMVFGSSLVALSEAFVIAERLGVSPQNLFDVLSTSSGDCWALHNFCPLPGLVEGSAADNNYAPKFAAALLSKDLGLAATAADSAGVELVVGRGAKDKLDELSINDGHLDASAVITKVGLKLAAAASGPI
ncbi:3-hydroxyisobutyrate dehydrogenase [Arthrobacter sp. VKM Ac-2550]|uniref:3-hydroxyisobutyrate dehydrogenase n=1 Tax=Crystallibacter permensis TaxID=1938888 RepID=UPI00222711D2|nr:3-hydroxyisobutyrate dehydrogenase [Arthrobacter sp. VKM Ac-2550]MCW2131220.1 3-hydroxyisobutyrate dehydrogenase [Arthrobacter sp. VKM Ac-2550]